MKPVFACLVIVSVLISPVGPVLGGGIASAAARPTPAGAATPAPVDGRWPRVYETLSGGRSVFYEPQVASWDAHTHIVLYSAVSYSSTMGAMPVLGTVRVESDTQVSVPDRLVSFSDLKVTATNFPTVSREASAKIVSNVTAAIPLRERVIGLDRVLAAIDTSQVKPRNVEGVKADPPAVYFSETPAVLVNINGDPIWSPIRDSDLRFAVNTNWDLFEFPPTRSYYLRIASSWMKASRLDGAWIPQIELPSAFSKLPDDDNWKDVRAAIPPKSLAVGTSVLISRKPAELIMVDGLLKYEAVPNTRLLWLSNTESDVFRIGKDGPIYYLVSGRWFTAPSFGGPWTFATPNLPDDFKHIPIGHPRSRVLASVPGTRQALEAVLLTQVPQTARVSRTQVQAPEVVYQGEPQFESIDKTRVARAANTDKDIIKVGDFYYMCYEGVWFMSRDSRGPWTVTDSVPGEVYEIPISSPAYNVTQVTVEGSDDEWVDFSATAAYSGMMVAWGCAVWGTGYHYPPSYWGDGYYPIYDPRYPSYGYGARYNPWTGLYSRAGAIYGPYGGAAYPARSNPRTAVSAQTHEGANVYGRWGSTGVQHGDQWATTSRVTNRAIGQTGAGNVYAGRDGNVYRSQGGGWQKYENGSWTGIEGPSPTGTTGQLGNRTPDLSTRDQLNRDQAARQEAAQRTRDLGKIRSGGFSRAGSYRPSGGGR